MFSKCLETLAEVGGSVHWGDLGNDVPALIKVHIFHPQEKKKYIYIIFVVYIYIYTFLDMLFIIRVYCITFLEAYVGFIKMRDNLLLSTNRDGNTS